MTGVKANWFVGQPAADPSCARIEDVAVPFDLKDPDAMLAPLTDLITKEARLWEQGITCAIRDRADTSCCACPVAHHEQPDHRLQPLCEVGREIERTATARAWLVAEGKT